jgi:hypothetical protein
VLGSFAFEHRDPLVHLPRLVKFECRDRQVVPDSEPGELALNYGQPFAFCFELHHHLLFVRANLAGHADPAN